MDDKGDKRRRSSSMKIDAAAVLRVAGALLMSAVAIAIVLSIFSGSLRLAPLVLMVALVHLFPAAILFCLLAWLGRISLVSCIASGALVAAVPIGIWTFPLSFSDSSFNAWSEAVRRLSTGFRRLRMARLWSVPPFLYRDRRNCWSLFLVSGRSLQAEMPIDLEIRKDASEGSFPSWLLPVFSALLIAGIVISPILTRDRSCHNVLRDGRTSASPALNAELTVSRDEWRNLESLYKRFALENGLEFRGSIDERPDVVSVLSLSMCSEPGFVIWSHKQHWHSRGGGPVPGRGVSVAVFLLEPEIEWIPLGQKFIEELSDHWPGQVRFRNGEGRIVSIEDTPLSGMALEIESSD